MNRLGHYLNHDDNDNFGLMNLHFLLNLYF